MNKKGQSVLKGELQGTVKAGQRSYQDYSMEFTAPVVPEKTQFVLQFSLHGNLKGVLADSFNLEVFPRSIPTLLKSKNTFLFDPFQDTAALLKSRGFQYSVLKSTDTLNAEMFLIIGRHALEKKEHKEFLKKCGFDKALTAGMRVLVFEQAATEIMTLKTEPLIGSFSKTLAINFVFGFIRTLLKGDR